MDIEEGKALVEKAMNVILSCKTEAQLHSACRYAGLVHREISDVLNYSGFYPYVDRSVGFAQCLIKNELNHNVRVGV